MDSNEVENEANYFNNSRKGIFRFKMAGETNARMVKSAKLSVQDNKLVINDSGKITTFDTEKIKKVWITPAK